MRDIEGDLFTSKARIIGHGVNTQGVMGAGIAVQFKKRWPDMYTAYREACLNEWLKPGEVFWWTTDDGLTIANIASQMYPGPNAKVEWLAQGLTEVADRAGRRTIAIPRIGAGIGGLKWEEVSWTIKQIERNRFAQFDVYWLP